MAAFFVIGKDLYRKICDFDATKWKESLSNNMKTVKCAQFRSTVNF